MELAALWRGFAKARLSPEPSAEPSGRYFFFSLRTRIYCRPTMCLPLRVRAAVVGSGGASSQLVEAAGG